LPKAKVYSWKNPKPLTTAVVLIMAFDALWALSDIFIQASWGERSNFTGIPPANWSLPQVLLWLHDILAFAVLAGGLVAIFWILRASKNASVLKGRNLENSPWFAALWWYVIPFMSLFKPLESISEIWDASAPDARSRKEGSPVLAVWWLCTIAGGVMGWVLRFFNGAWPAIVMQSVFTIVQCLAFAYIAQRIGEMQIEKQMVIVFSDTEAPMSVLERVTG
jgi:hypothetical protein